MADINYLARLRRVEGGERIELAARKCGDHVKSPGGQEMPKMSTTTRNGASLMR